ncbi:hypothetical protein ACMA5I_09060 [Paracoccaceae bacterium GXU_MW_L88]
MIQRIYTQIHDFMATHDEGIVRDFASALPPLDDLGQKHRSDLFIDPSYLLHKMGDSTDETRALAESALSLGEEGWANMFPPGDYPSRVYEFSAWLPVAMREGPLVWTRGVVEFMIIGAGRKLPTVRHPGDELYVVLAGEVASDRREFGRTELGANMWLRNPPYTPHNLETKDVGAMILTIWRDLKENESRNNMEVVA